MAWTSRRRRSPSSVWAFIVQNPVLGVLVVAAVALLFLSRSQEEIVQAARSLFDDASSSALEAVAKPTAEGKRWLEGVTTFFSTYEENQRLRDENARLRTAQSELAEMQRKVGRYEQLLKIPAESPVTSIAGRVIADTSGPFVRTILVSAGRDQGVEKGQAVVDDRGLLGRIIGAGKRSARVLLLSDLNSRIPVIVEGANLKAILVGDNSDRPTLEYLPPGSRLVAGARVVTTADGAALPPGVAIGIVVKGEGSPKVQLFTSEGRADFVRVLHYRIENDVDEEAPQSAPTDPAKPRIDPKAATPKPASPAGNAGPGARPATLMRFR
ncbi:MAG: rod shape-determining protein MreC [Micropepsaceae bacterium]